MQIQYIQMRMSKTRKKKQNKTNEKQTSLLISYIKKQKQKNVNDTYKNV